VDTNGLPIHLALTPEEAHDNRLCSVLLSALRPETMLLADRWYDANWIRELARQHGRIFRRSEIAKTQSASARICIVRAISLNGSSTRSSNVAVSRPDMTSSQPTIWHSSNSHQSEFGCVLMSPRPS
jgi:hypothetical protein